MVKSIRQKKRVARMRKEAGFGLIEVMISAVILGIGLLAVATAAFQSFEMNGNSKKMIHAVSAAESMLELARRNSTNLADYNGLNSSTSTSTSTPAMVDADFLKWQKSVDAIEPFQGESKDNPSGFNCIAPSTNTKAVPRSCGLITVAPGLTGSVSTVTVEIFWPSRPDGIAITTSIQQL